VASPSLPVTLDDVIAAQDLLSGVVRPTPLEYSRALSERVGADVYLKCENLQRAGSFKIRGAYTRIARLSEEEKARGIVAASAGNHAQGVALAAQLLGIDSTVFMPIGAPIPKLLATRAYGAHVEQVGTTVDEALVAAKEMAASTGAILIHPFDHADIVAGQGTCGLEILDQCPDVKTIVTSAGGGGLLAGISTAVRALRPQARIVGVQAEGAAAYPASLAAGHPLALTTMTTMADGIAVGRPGDVPFALVSRYVDDVVTVTDEDRSAALLVLLERHKMVVEPAGGASVAALLTGKVDLKPPIVAILSGGNIDPMLLLRVIEHGLVSAGRFLRLAVRTGDQPGELARLLAEIAEQRANIVDVAHSRQNPRLSFGEVEVQLSVETRGPDHSAALIGALRSQGYPLTLLSGTP